jgi:hypothetical protein
MVLALFAASLAARGRAILGLLDDVSHAEALDLACRTLVGVLLAARPGSRSPSQIRPATTRSAKRSSSG